MGKSAWLAGAAAGVVGCGTAWAEEVAPDVRADEITVTATRIARPLLEVPATVSVVSDAEIEDGLVSDIKDLVRFEPGVSVRSAPSRFTAAGANTGREGNAGFNIRGLEGNRVLILVDGVRVPDAFSFGGQSMGRGDYVDLDLLKSVEIVRGPASALYGSDGLAGVVSFVTRDPGDVAGAGGGVAARARAAYASADASWAESVLGAFVLGEGAFSGLVSYTRRDGSETETQGEDDSPDVRRTMPNPQDLQSNSWLGKLVYSPARAHRVRLTYEHADHKALSEVLSARAAPPAPGQPPLASTATLDLDALDTSERSRAGVDYRYAGEGVLDAAVLGVYLQTSETFQYSAEDRAGAADRIRINTFDNEVRGGSLQLESDLAAGAVTHRFVYGADYSSTRQEGVRDGAVPPAGETFPTRAFPNTDYALGGVFLQDEIGLLGGALSLYPSVRYDAYELEPEIDPLFTWTAEGQSGSRVTPRLGVVYWPTEQFGLFANAAQGFKAPAPPQVNNGFANVVANYRSVPNPDLEAETSESVEAGVRFRRVGFLGGDWSGQLAGFTGTYDDFIEQIQVSGSFTPADPAIFQFVNLSEVEISGAELRVEARWDGGLTFDAAASTAEGDQKTDGDETPLASIDPLKLVAGLGWRDPGDRYGGELRVTWSAQKEYDRVGMTCAGGCYTPDAFAVVDLTAFWNVGDHATLRVGVFNLTDETYAWWSDARGLGAASTVLDAYTQPGRNASASLSLGF